MTIITVNKRLMQTDKSKRLRSILRCKPSVGRNAGYQYEAKFKSGWVPVSRKVASIIVLNLARTLTGGVL